MDKTMIVAGIGSRKGVSREQVLGAINTALGAHDLDIARLDALATGKLKQHEDAIFQAGRQLRRAIIIIGDAELAEAGKRARTHSELSLEATGAPSLSEAAALAAAGPGSRLLGPRIVRDAVTCAIAISGDKA
ncbi:cobalamin biosynthesis protein [Pseudaminobacter salicylatoxidans]|uniref:cobalamin biosynthesis protein n=1 Tax=Pseudaminobacter salicylatoxidans TaxID=93369 RepID=UPI0003793BE1|nr:cobalamin biosynthesis protein [Pseudaminobacter salicylatoxidans]